VLARQKLGSGMSGMFITFETTPPGNRPASCGCQGRSRKRHGARHHIRTACCRDSRCASAGSVRRTGLPVQGDQCQRLQQIRYHQHESDAENRRQREPQDQLRHDRSPAKIPAVEHGDAVGLDTEQLTSKALQETEYPVDEDSPVAPSSRRAMMSLQTAPFRSIRGALRLP